MPNTPLRKCKLCGGALGACNRIGICRKNSKCCALNKRETARRNYAKNPEKKRATSRRWSARNPEKKRAAGRHWYAANTKKAKANAQRWSVANPEKRKANVQRSRAKNKNALNASATFKRRLRGSLPRELKIGARANNYAGGRVCFCSRCGQSLGWRFPYRLPRGQALCRSCKEKRKFA